MDVEEIRQYALSKGDVEEGFPFGGDALVFKIKGKMFLLLMMSSSPVTFNAKCDPEKAMEWRERYSSVEPGYHMNKKHWNTVTVDGSLRRDQLKEMIDDSFQLVAKIK
jgi:predicted DNA-binding protein (MmcQ/YjbR family)